VTKKRSSTDIVIRRLEIVAELFGDRLQYSDGLIGHFWTNAISRKNGDTN
jgi:hypothetical protein